MQSTPKAAAMQTNKAMLVRVRWKGLLWVTMGIGLLLGVPALAITAAGQTKSEQSPRRPYTVDIRDEKTIVAEPVLPLDKTKYAQVQVNNLGVQIRVESQIYHLGQIYTVLKIDDQIVHAGNPPGRIVQNTQRLPAKRGRASDAFMTVYAVGKVHIKQIVEVTATKPGPKFLPGQRRRLDAVLVRYEIENQDNRPHKVGLLVWCDMYLLNNDGALFAAPTYPDQVLDGMEIKGKKVPDYLQVLQQPNLKNPGSVAHFTFNLGRKYPRPDRIVLTRLGSMRSSWELIPQQAMGDSAMGFYWDPSVVPAGRSRNLAYAYGRGIAMNPENEGAVTLELDGSFEPGKTFTVSAYVQDPGEAQSLTLDLPPGLQLVDGQRTQPVPEPNEDGYSLVVWNVQVLQVGRFPLRVLSSNGVLHNKIITIRRTDAR